MTASDFTPQGTITRLTPADLGASSKAVQENLKRQAFREWPNEAGFDGLTEHRGPVELKVKGTIPAWAAGSLYRTGPGQGKVEGTKTNTFYISHWFDGLAHTHRFDIVAEENANGEQTVRVYYSSRRQSEKRAADIRARGSLQSITFAQRRDPCVGLFAKFTSVFSRQKAPPNVAVTVRANMPSFEARTNGHRAANVVLGTDATHMCEIDPDTMEPIEITQQTKFHPDLKGPLSAAHGEVDPETGDYFNYNLDVGKQPVYRIFRVSAATGKTDILAVIPYKAAYIHSLFLTRNYVVLYVPVAHFALNGFKIVLENNLKDAIKPFDPAETCRWFVIDRWHGKGVVAEFASPARFFFHTVNAFEEDDDKGGGTGNIICEVVDYPNRHIIDGFYYDVLLNRNDQAAQFWTAASATIADDDKDDKDDENAQELQRQQHQHQQQLFSRLARYRLRKDAFTSTSITATTTATEKSIDPTDHSASLPAPELVTETPAPHAGELPVINPRYRGRRHRYAYLAVTRARSTLFDAIAKVDMDAPDGGEVLLWEGPLGHTPGEAIFVPRLRQGSGPVGGTNGINGTSETNGEGKGSTEQTDEDDGVLLSVVLDGANKTSYLLCLDAKTMTELGKAECEFAVAFGLHGCHVPTA
ncbi:hypothetical protein VTI28DRAFT_1798 [Corynascus sepedonium]